MDGSGRTEEVVAAYRRVRIKNAMHQCSSARGPFSENDSVF